MAYYRRMGSVENHLGGNATSTTLLHYLLRDLWSSPRGTVLRIEALALLAIALSFFLAAFGSCRRWSNLWIVQKGFLAAQALSLSLGTYSIGLMQSSSVKSEMYPIWTVSLLTLFGCVDPVTTYNGLDYKGPLSKMTFQLCLYLGYALLMSVSIISGDVGKLAIVMLSAITFMKGFHRSLAFVLPSRTRSSMVSEWLESAAEPNALAGDRTRLQVLLSFFTHYVTTWNTRTTLTTLIYMDDIHSSYNMMLDKLQLKEATVDGVTIEDVCLGYSLSHLLQQRFLGLDKATQVEKKRENFESLIRAGRSIDYRRAMKAAEVELAFLYEVFFTSNEFLHYYEAKTSSFWALASFVGICFVGAVAAIPGTMASDSRSSTYAGPGAGIFFVETTTADLIITLVILASLSLLQLVQLIRCWTSNWAKVAFACEFAACRPGSTTNPGSSTISICSSGDGRSPRKAKGPSWWRWMRLKAFAVTRMNWFDKFLWQDQLGQYSLVDATRIRKECPLDMIPPFAVKCLLCLYFTKIFVPAMCLCDRLPGVLGMQYIRQVIRELWVCDTNTGAPFRLHDDVKTSVADFLGQIKSRRIGKDWSSLFVDNGLDADHLPYSTAPLQVYGSKSTAMSDGFAFMHRVMVWHITTWYCELAEKEGSAGSGGGGERGGGESHTHSSSDHEDADREEKKKKKEKNRRVATALKYCAYLAVSALELLPGPPMETKRAFNEAVEQTSFALRGARNKMEAMRRSSGGDGGDGAPPPPPPSAADAGNVVRTDVYWGKRLLNETPPPADCVRRRSDDHWEVLARLWVQTLLYAAPYGDVQRHMQHLSQGGEFITHLWALLYHLGIDRWEVAGIDELKAAPAAETTQVQAQAEAGELEIEEIN